MDDTKGDSTLSLFDPNGLIGREVSGAKLSLN